MVILETAALFARASTLSFPKTPLDIGDNITVIIVIIVVIVIIVYVGGAIDYNVVLG